jgi:hypothetical protein
MHRALVTGLCLLLLCGSAEGNDRAAVELFETRVRPILVSHCLECHGDQAAGDLDLRTHESAVKGGASGRAIVAGDATASLLYQKIAAGEMPPKSPLGEGEIALLKVWIEKGAPYSDGPIDPFAITTDHRAGYDWWALQPLKAEEPSSVPGTPASWHESPIDRFVYKALHDKGLSPNKPATPRTLIRRLTYDLHGLPPTPQEVSHFVEACRAETGVADQVGDAAYRALVDRLLASPHYGERWGRHWLDVVRFGESNGFERNVLIGNVWPYRDYVIASLNDDKPFDQFIREQLAGDQLAPDDPNVMVGTAMLVCGPYDNVGNQDAAAAAQIRADAIDEMIRVVTEGCLGLTVGCARCHDHKFDPISQRDYYSLYATFAGVHHGDRPVPVPPPEGQGETRWWIGVFTEATGPFHVFRGGSPQQPGDVVSPASMRFLESVVPTYALPSDSPEHDRRLKLGEWITSPQNPLTPRVLVNRLWHHHFGAGLVSTPSDFGFLGERPSHPELLDWLARRLQQSGWQLKPLHRDIVLSQTYRQSSEYRADSALVDADSRLLWRFPPQRLSSEAIRDATLAVAGKLDTRMGGPGFRLFQYVQDNVATYHPLDHHGPETYRRAVYHHNARATQIDLLSEYDTPDCAFAAPRRSTTTSPLQALTSLNHQFTLDMAAALAQRLEREAATTEARVNLAFELAFSRAADAEELSRSTEFIDQHGLPAFARAILNTSEFLYVE